MAKLGAHIVPGSRNGFGLFCEAKPAVVLAVDDGGALVEAKQKSGGYTITIFRDTSVYTEAPEGFNTAPDMVALANQQYPLLKAKWQQNPADYYTITNEIGGNDEAVLVRLVTYERRIKDLANADGLKVCVLNLAGGSPGDIEVWKRVCLPFIVEAWAGRNIYGRHSYGEGDLVTFGGSVVIGNPSRPFEEIGHLRAAGAAGGVVITECGIDAGFGFAGVERFTRQMTGYEKLLRPYPEFIGLCSWTLGNWSEANWQDALPAVTQYLIDNPTPKWTWPAGTPPPIPPSDNLLPNPGFEAGWWHIDGWPELQIAESYDTEWKDGEPTPAGDGTMYVRPEYRVLPKAYLPPAEQPLFVLDGQQTIKIFKGSGAINAVYKSQPFNLTPGRYRLTIPLYPDAVEGYVGGQKVFAHDPASADCRAWVDGEQGEWFTPFPFGNWYQLVHEFTVAEARPVQVGVRLRNIHALQNSGWFTDAWRLERVDEEPPPPPAPAYLHTRLIAPANIRRDPSTNNPAITPVAVKAGLELIKVGNVTGQSVSGNNQWVKAVAFISRPYVTNSTPGKVKTNRSVNLRVVPTTAANWPLVLLPAGIEFEHLGNVDDLSNNGQWAAVALYIWQPLAMDAQPGIRFGRLTPGTLSVSSPFNAPRQYPFAPTKKQLHEGLDFYVPIGTAVLAGAAGTVDFVRTVDPGFGYGKAVRIKHSDRYTTWLGHLSRVDVSVGQQVTAGQQVALSGNSGGSTGPHLHWTLVDNPTGLDGYVIDNVTDPTLYLHPAVNLQPGTPPPGEGIDLVPYFTPANGQYGDIVILKNNWGEGDERQQLQQSGSNLYVTKNASFEQRVIRANTLDLVLDTSRGNGEMYTVSGPWILKKMAVGQSFTRTETVQVKRKDNCQNVGNPYTSTSQIKLVAHHASLPIEGGVTVQDVIELHWILGGIVEERYFYGRHKGLVQWKPKDNRRSWAVEVIPYGQQENNGREVIPCL